MKKILLMFSFPTLLLLQIPLQAQPVETRFSRRTGRPTEKNSEITSEFYFYFSKQDPALKEGHARVACMKDKDKQRAHYYLDAREVKVYKDEEEARGAYARYLQKRLSAVDTDDDEISIVFLGQGVKAFNKSGHWYCPIEPEKIESF